MKVIRNGRKYDTKTATMVGDWCNMPDSRDFYYCYEALYRKQNGEFFLYGCGGPCSRYSVSCGSNSWSGSERIIPLSIDEAREWAEEHLDGDEYEKIFGEVTED